MSEQQPARWTRSARWCCASQGTAAPVWLPALLASVATAPPLMHPPAAPLPTPVAAEQVCMAVVTVAPWGGGGGLLCSKKWGRGGVVGGCYVARHGVARAGSAV